MSAVGFNTSKRAVKLYEIGPSCHGSLPPDVTGEKGVHSISLLFPKWPLPLAFAPPIHFLSASCALSIYPPFSAIGLSFSVNLPLRCRSGASRSRSLPPSILSLHRTLSISLPFSAIGLSCSINLSPHCRSGISIFLRFCITFDPSTLSPSPSRFLEIGLSFSISLHLRRSPSSRSGADLRQALHHFRPIHPLSISLPLALAPSIHSLSASHALHLPPVFCNRPLLLHQSLSSLSVRYLDLPQALHRFRPIHPLSISLPFFGNRSLLLRQSPSPSISMFHKFSNSASLHIVFSYSPCTLCLQIRICQLQHHFVNLNWL